MAARRLRDVFLVPDPGNRRDKPSPDQLRAMTYLERRRAKMEYAAHGGHFRTWVYAVTLVLLVGGLACYVALVG